MAGLLNLMSPGILSTILAQQQQQQQQQGSPLTTYRPNAPVNSGILSFPTNPPPVGVDPNAVDPGGAMRRDSAPLADPIRKAASERSLWGLMFNPNNDFERELGNRAIGRMLSGNFVQGVGQAAAGFEDDLSTYGMPSQAALERQAMIQKLNAGDLVPVGANTGVYYDRQTGRVVQPPKEAIEALSAVSQAQAKAKAAADKASGASDAISEYAKPYIDPETGRKYMMGVSGAGRPVVMDTKGQVVTDEKVTDRIVPETNFNASDSKREKALYSYADTVRKRADAANNGLTLTNLMRQASRTGDPGLAGDAVRQLAQWLGADIGNVNLADLQSRQAFLNQMSVDIANQKFAGTGPITDYERRMIAEMLPRVGVDPRAFGQLATLLDELNNRALDTQAAWWGYRSSREKADPDEFDAMMQKAWRDAKTEVGVRGDPLKAKAWSKFMSGMGVPGYASPAAPAAPAAPATSPTSLPNFTPTDGGTVTGNGQVVIPLTPQTTQGGKNYRIIREPTN